MQSVWVHEDYFLLAHNLLTKAPVYGDPIPLQPASEASA